MPNRTRWILPLAAMLFAATPWLFGLSIKPDGRSYFASYVKAPGDTSVYYRYINEGRAGGPFMIDGFTAEEHPAVLWQPLWWVLGQKAVLLNITTPIVFFLARVFFSGVLALVIVWAASKVFSDGRTRVVASWLAYFGAGLGGLVAIIWPDYTLDRAPIYDLWVSEGYSWLSSLATPHFLLVSAGLLFIVTGVEYAWSQRWVRWLVGPVFLLVISIHPFHILTIGLAWLGLSTVEVFTHPDWMRRLWRRVAVGAWALPALAYYFAISQLPIIAGRSAQNVNQTFVLAMALGVAPLLVLAVVALVQRRRAAGAMIAWLGALTAVVFLPVIFPRRFFQPTSIILAFVAAPLVAAWLRGRAWQQWGMVLLFIIMALTPAVVIRDSFRYTWDNAKNDLQTFSYLTPDFTDAQVRLRSHPTWSPVLAGRLNSNILAATAPIRPFIGHGVETLSFGAKQVLVQGFFSSMTPAQQATFLEQQHICSILVTPYEETYGRPFTTCPLENCSPVYKSPSVTLWLTGLCPVS